MNADDFPLPEPTLEDHEHELWGQNVRSNFYTEEQVRSILRSWLAAHPEQGGAVSLVNFNATSPRSLDVTLGAHHLYASPVHHEQKATSPAPREQPKNKCALCWEQARFGSVCDACHDSMGTTTPSSQKEQP